MRIDSRRYSSREFHELERERLWPRVWLLVAHGSEVLAPGSFVTTEVGSDVFLIMRGADRLRCFHNVCVHRGTLLCVERRGLAETIRCPYHGWCYDTAGRLVGGQGAEALVARGEGLVEVNCEERAGFVWIRASREGPSLDEFLGPLLPILLSLELDAMRLRADRSFSLDCNWKLSSDIHNEALHLTTVHPDLCEFIDVPAIRWEALGLHSRFTIPLGVPSTGPFAGRIGPQLAGLLKEAGVEVADLATTGGSLSAAVRSALRSAFRSRASAGGMPMGPLDEADKHQFYVFPNVQLNVTGLDLEIYRHFPHSSDPLRCRFENPRFDRAPPGAPATTVRHEVRDAATQDPKTALGQDLALAPRVQRGMLSSGFVALRTGPLEDAIAHMHRGIDSFVESPGVKP